MPHNYFEMDIVSFETAKRLKEAGSPQPKPAFGQFWYGEILSGKIELWVIALDDFGGLRFRCCSSIRRDHKIELSEKFVFAPTATDILPQMIYSELRCEVEMWMLHLVKKDALPVIRTDGTFFNQNPAEACAEAWLKMNEK